MLTKFLTNYEILMIKILDGVPLTEWRGFFQVNLVKTRSPCLKLIVRSSVNTTPDPWIMQCFDFSNIDFLSFLNTVTWVTDNILILCNTCSQCSGQKCTGRFGLSTIHKNDEAERYFGARSFCPLVTKPLSLLLALYNLLGCSPLAENNIV
jgi:hypothetical protein